MDRRYVTCDGCHKTRAQAAARDCVLSSEAGWRLSRSQIGVWKRVWFNGRGEGRRFSRKNGGLLAQGDVSAIARRVLLCG